ncbi:unnamed protein product, partial [Amoebophrya sp. A25]
DIRQKLKRRVTRISLLAVETAGDLLRIVQAAEPCEGVRGGLEGVRGEQVVLSTPEAGENEEISPDHVSKEQSEQGIVLEKRRGLSLSSEK